MSSNQSRKTNRDDFPERTKETVAKRVGMRCSNPSCRKLTSGPREDPNKAVSIGVAAHITAAAPRGPRYDVFISPAVRTSIKNAIWLCQNCAKLVDSDAIHYSTEMLQGWKEDAEENTRLAIETNASGADNVKTVRKLLRQKIRELDDLVRSEDLTRADIKAQTLLDDLASSFSGLPQEDRAEALAGIAGYYAFAGNSKRAQEIVLDAESLSRDHPRVRMASAKILALAGKHEEALRRLEGLDKENAVILGLAIRHEMGDSDLPEVTALESSDTPEAHGALASHYLATEQMALSEKHARKAVKKSPTSHNLWMLGRILVRRTLAERYGNPYPHFHLATFVPSEKESRRLAEACDYLQNAVTAARSSLSTTDPRTKERELCLLECLTLYDEHKAVELAIELLKKDPTNFRAAGYLLYKGEYQREFELLQHVDISEIDDDTSAMTLAGALMESGHPDKARDALVAWGEANTVIDHYRWTQLLARANRALGNEDEAADIIESFRSTHGQTDEYDKLLATHLAETGDRNGAESLVDRIVERHPDKDNLLFAYATLEGVSQPGKLIGYLHDLTKLSPRREFYYELIVCCFKAQDYQGVLQSVRAARANNLSDAAYDKAEGTALYFLGNFAEARSFLRSAYEAQKLGIWFDHQLGTNLATCELLLGDEEAFVKVSGELLERPDVTPDVYRGLLHHYSRIGRDEKAYELAKSAAARFPNDEAARSWEVFYATPCGHTEEAAAAIQRFVVDFPHSHAIMRMTPEEGIACLRSAHERQNQIWKMYQQGDIPRVFHTDFSRFALVFDWIAATGAVGHTGNAGRPPTYVSPATDHITPGHDQDPSETGAVLDYTCMLTLQSLGLLETAVSAIGTVYYPTELLVALLEEIRRVSSISPDRDERAIVIDNLVNRKAILVQEEISDWGSISSLLKERYLLDHIGAHAAVNLWFAHEVGAYYLDEYLLDNPHMPVPDGWPENLIDGMISIADLVEHLWDKGTLSSALRQRVTKRIQRYGCTSKARPPRLAGEWSPDKGIVVNLTTLETVTELGLLHDLLAAYDGRIWLPLAGYHELKGRLAEAVTNTLSKTHLEAIHGLVTKSPHMMPVSLTTAERSFSIGGAEEHHHIGLMSETVCVATSRGIVLYADDRAIRRLQVDGLVTASTIHLLGYLYDAGQITAEQYEESYLKLLQWNCLFVPLDANVLIDILSRSPVRSKDSCVVSRYYKSAIQDAGLSKSPYTAGRPESDALAFYNNYTASLANVLALIWANDSLSDEHKIEVSNFIHKEMWQEPEAVVATADGSEEAEIIRILWHVRLVEIVGGANEDLPGSFAGWYFSKWLKPDIDRSTLGISGPSSATHVSGSDIVTWAKQTKQAFFELAGN